MLTLEQLRLVDLDTVRDVVHTLNKLPFVVPPANRMQSMSVSRIIDIVDWFFLRSDFSSIIGDSAVFFTCTNICLPDRCNFPHRIRLSHSSFH